MNFDWNKLSISIEPKSLSSVIYIQYSSKLSSSGVHVKVTVSPLNAMMIGLGIFMDDSIHVIKRANIINFMFEMVNVVVKNTQVCKIGMYYVSAYPILQSPWKYIHMYMY